MFTGLVADRGAIESVLETDEGVRLTLSSSLAVHLGEGDSIAVNGVCLTATGVERDRFAADVMHETLDRSTLSGAAAGDPVNLELSLRAADRLGGHIMQGHVDGIGTVTAVRADGFARVLTIAAASDVLRYVVLKGSIAVDGVSLTVARIDGEGFDVSLIPETLERTNLRHVQAGTTVNLEVDVLAKYLEKLLNGRGAA